MNPASARDHRHWRVFPMFLKIWIAGLPLGAGSVGDQEILRLQDQKRMMPDIWRIGDALVAARVETAKPVKIRCAVIRVGRGHHHQTFMVGKRHEGLSAERLNQRLDVEMQHGHLLQVVGALRAQLRGLGSMPCA